MNYKEVLMIFAYLAAALFAVGVWYNEAVAIIIFKLLALGFCAVTLIRIVRGDMWPYKDKETK